jgi:hypothetical protein
MLRGGSAWQGYRRVYPVVLDVVIEAALLDVVDTAALRDV